MAISKVTLNGDTLMDVTQDTVTANNLLSGETATGADGVRLTGTLIPSSEPVLQAKTVTPTSSEQVIVPDGYACTPSVYTSNAQSYSAGAQINSSVFFYSGSLIEEQTYRVLGRLDVVDASGTVLEYYDIDSEFIWNTTYQDVLINGATEYVQCLKLGKGSAYNQVKLFLKLNLAGTFGFTLKIYFYEENASYDGLSQVTVNPIPSQYIVPSGTKTITENGTGIDVASYASVDVSVSGGTIKRGVLRPDAELVNSWTYDKMIVRDEGVSIPSYGTSAVVLKASEDLDTVTLDRSTYSYMFIARGIAAPIYSSAEVGTGRFHIYLYSNVYEDCVFPRGTSIANTGAYNELPISEYEECKHSFYFSYSTLYGTGQQVGIYMGSPGFAITDAGIATIKSPIFYIRGSTTFLTQTYWDLLTDIRYQYVIELYRVPNASGSVNGFNTKSNFGHIIDCTNSQTGTLT